MNAVPETALPATGPLEPSLAVPAASARERFVRETDWNLLRTFVIVVETGGFTLAAARLMRSQPTVSNAIRRLEERLGAPLIHRGRGSIELTELGRRVHDHARAMHDAVHGLAELVGDANGEEAVAGDVRLLLASHLDLPRLDRALAAFHAAHPAATLVVETLPSATIIAEIESGAAGIGVAFKRPADGRVRATWIGQSAMAFFCGRSHPLFGRRELEVADLREHGYVAYESDRPGEGLEALASLRMDRRIGSRMVAVSPNDEEVLRLIRAGIGYGALTLAHAAPFARAGELWRLPPNEGLPSFDIHLVSAVPSRLSTGERALLGLMTDASNGGAAAGGGSRPDPEPAPSDMVPT